MSNHEFKAESKRLLDLMINAIYTQRDIFLREIISNASDALDKLAYLALTDEHVGKSREDFQIHITADLDARTLTIADNGIGMTEADLTEHLGTIAKSGSRHFKAEHAENEDLDIIGQFGVGFYSAFMVADQIEVKTRAYGSATAYLWSSHGAEGYTIASYEKETVGTEIILHLRADTADDSYSDYLQADKLSQLIQKYSDYIRYPIILDGETRNRMIPIWQLPKSEASDEDCFAFYKETYFDFEDPLSVQRVSAEGTSVSYRAMLFYPASAPYNYYSRDYKAGLSLYTAGVMILEHCPDLLPEHFRFVRGIVDSSDLSLNISREMLQQDRQVKTISQSLEKKIKSELLRLMKSSPDAYERLFKSFGLQIKYGLVQDYGAKKEFLRDLILFHSAKENKLISLQDYVSAMPPEQTYIYFATGASLSKIAQKPQLEAVFDAGYDVLYLTDDVDEFCVQMLETHADKAFQSIYEEDLGLNEQNESELAEEDTARHQDLLDFVLESLDGALSKVRLSPNLKSHPVALSAQGSLSLEMEQYFASLAQQQGGDAPRAERVLELNPNHPAFKALAGLFETDKEKAAKYAKLYYHQALLLADLPLPHTAEYVSLVWDLLS